MEKTIAEAIDSVAYALRLLGNADAATPMGGLEALGAVLGEKLERVSDSLGSVASAIEYAADTIAGAFETGNA